jgi:hypothetical protein
MFRIQGRTAVAAAVVAVGATFGAASANATVITFTGFNGQQLPYWEEQDFLFDPAKSNNDSKCYETECLMEIGQGEVTTMTYDASGGGPYGGKEQGEVIDPSPNYGDPFTLSFFYFVLIGNGEDQENSFTVTGNKVGGGTVSAQFVLDGATGPVVNGAVVSFAGDADTNNNDVDNGVIQKNVGYWVDLDPTLWSNLLSAVWTANTFDGNGNQVLSAQMLLDCVGANESGLGSESNCAPTTTVIPLPAPILLLLGGIGALGLAARRRKDGVMV